MNGVNRVSMRNEMNNINWRDIRHSHINKWLAITVKRKYVDKVLGFFISFYLYVLVVVCVSPYLPPSSSFLSVSVHDEEANMLKRWLIHCTHLSRAQSDKWMVNCCRILRNGRRAIIFMFCCRPPRPANSFSAWAHARHLIWLIINIEIYIKLCMCEKKTLT